MNNFPKAVNMSPNPPEIANKNAFLNIKKKDSLQA
jgi:hypothetical protein